MALYELTPADVADLLTLIASPSLTIQANNAQRLAQLQVKLATLKPSDELAKVGEELDKVRAELETTHGALLATERQRQEWIERASQGCKHEMRRLPKTATSNCRLASQARNRRATIRARTSTRRSQDTQQPCQPAQSCPLDRAGGEGVA